VGIVASLLNETSLLWVAPPGGCISLWPRSQFYGIARLNAGKEKLLGPWRPEFGDSAEGYLVGVRAIQHNGDSKNHPEVL